MRISSEEISLFLFGLGLLASLSYMFYDVIKESKDSWDQIIKESDRKFAQEQGKWRVRMLFCSLLIPIPLLPLFIDLGYRKFNTIMTMVSLSIEVLALILFLASAIFFHYYSIRHTIIMDRINNPELLNKKITLKKSIWVMKISFNILVVTLLVSLVGYAMIGGLFAPQRACCGKFDKNGKPIQIDGTGLRELN